MGKSTISMAFSNCYVSSPEGNRIQNRDFQGLKVKIRVFTPKPENLGRFSASDRLRCVGRSQLADMANNIQLISQIYANNNAS